VDDAGADHHPCSVCGSIYRTADEASRCERAPVEPERISPGTIVEVSPEDAPATGPGYVRTSYLLGLDDPRGPAHTRMYRASFLWGRADFRFGELSVRGPATEAEWRAEIEGR